MEVVSSIKSVNEASVHGASIAELVRNSINEFPLAAHVYIHDHWNGLSLSVLATDYVQTGTIKIPFEGRKWGYINPDNSILLKMNTYPKEPFDYAIFDSLGELMKGELLPGRDTLRALAYTCGRYVMDRNYKIEKEEQVGDVLSDIASHIKSVKESDFRPMMLRQYPLMMYPLLVESYLGLRNVSINVDEPDHMGRFGRSWFWVTEDLVKDAENTYRQIDEVLRAMKIDVSSMKVRAIPFYR